MASRAPEPLSVLVVSASPHRDSRPDWVADRVADVLATQGCATRHLRVRELTATALVLSDLADTSVLAARTAVADAAGLVLVTPIYRASYSGLLKLFLDLLPRYALTGKTVLPLATGGSRAHTLALEYAVRPVVQVMGARHVVRGHFTHDQELPRRHDGRITPLPGAEADLEAAIDAFHSALALGALSLGEKPLPWNSGV